MNLFIQVENGRPVNHPAFEDNIIEAFGGVPDNWEPFIRVERPILSMYEILEFNNLTYEKINGTWTDVWAVRPMTEQEKTILHQAVVAKFNQRPQAENWSAWTLDELTNTMVPPIPRPEPDEAKLTLRIFTFWCGADNNWKDTPVRPEGNYKFDFFNWQWVEVIE